MGFKNNFMWGAASAAYQIEGAHSEDGKGLGIWDVLSKEKGRVIHGESADVSCDHYHRYQEDVNLMKEIGLKYYRFSISWTRILPDGIGKVNNKGLKFYSDLVDALLEAGIEPMITLFHWDYPYTLYEKGGWKNENSPDWFAEYTSVVIDALSDRVKYWITFNEPQLFVGAGHLAGFHAPFERCEVKEIAQISHNVLLAHGKAVKVIRESTKQPCMIGLAPTGPCCTPQNNTDEAIEEARKTSFDFQDISGVFGNSWWMDPVVFGKYPESAQAVLGNDMPDIKEGDMELISQPIDFYGCNIYQSISDYNPSADYASNAYLGCPRTMMGWPVTPEVLYWAPKFLYERYKLPILVAENGLASMDWVSLDGKVHDSMRKDFIHRYLLEYQKAADEGVDLMGYMYWSLMDNFEWADGFDKRFGLIYIDYQTQKRTVKDSAYWYQKVIESNGENLRNDNLL
jgi:beta-glucosidase